jgi:hypothetical protein
MSFDPHREWLGIESTAPDYYELLGIDDRGDDPGKIIAAADRALARVRSCHPGPHKRSWTALLGSLAEAKSAWSTRDNGMHTMLHAPNPQPASNTYLRPGSIRNDGVHNHGCGAGE